MSAEEQRGVAEYRKYLEDHCLQHTQERMDIWIAAWNKSWDECLNGVLQTIDRVFKK